ncbi:uncharacterized protein EI90DRAFT_3024748 [Cantharellus anzutake]|uniref:uncharacterized protein n=1 Tax=Cantharellus anzutake TaxID=1750568 RepID=UPI001906C038|nr:uncharacterized protein EI90DRAFT_3024748 [Cantharellus anzutake]KAF8309958.1 hypothetical protein EI90DRAFT_3024748 [Cantharellus anzutake]
MQKRNIRTANFVDEGVSIDNSSNDAVNVKTILSSTRLWNMTIGRRSLSVRGRGTLDVGRANSSLPEQRFRGHCPETITKHRRIQYKFARRFRQGWTTNSRRYGIYMEYSDESEGVPHSGKANSHSCSLVVELPTGRIACMAKMVRVTYGHVERGTQTSRTSTLDHKPTDIDSFK